MNIKINQINHKKPSGRFHPNSNIRLSQCSHNSAKWRKESKADVEQKTVFHNVSRFFKSFNLVGKRVSAYEWYFAPRNSRQSLLKVSFKGTILTVQGLQAGDFYRFLRLVRYGHPEATDWENLKTFCLECLNASKAESAHCFEGNGFVLETKEHDIEKVLAIAAKAKQAQIPGLTVSLLSNVKGGRN